MAQTVRFAHEFVPKLRQALALSATYGTMYGMKRTTIYLPDELKAALERTAARAGTSEAEVVRSAIAVATADDAGPRPRLPLFASRDETLAERVNEELAAGFAE
jgi:Ribbon-helix-helix protein, copG family